MFYSKNTFLFGCMSPEQPTRLPTLMGRLKFFSTVPWSNLALIKHIHFVISVNLTSAREAEVDNGSFFSSSTNAIQSLLPNITSLGIEYNVANLEGPRSGRARIKEFSGQVLQITYDKRYGVYKAALALSVLFTMSSVQEVTFLNSPLRTKDFMKLLLRVCPELEGKIAAADAKRAKILAEKKERVALFKKLPPEYIVAEDTEVEGAGLEGAEVENDDLDMQNPFQGTFI